MTEDALEYVFLRVVRRINNAFRQRLDNDITGPQLYLLSLLQDYGPQKISDLAEKANVTCGNITLLGDRLVKAGYVERERSEADRRIVLLSITDAGVKLLESVQELRSEIMAPFMAVLSEAEKQQMKAIMDKLIAVE